MMSKLSECSEEEEFVFWPSHVFGVRDAHKSRSLLPYREYKIPHTENI